MASPKAQVPDNVAAVKAAAAASNSVPELRKAVSDLTDEVAALRARVAKLEGRRE